MYSDSDMITSQQLSDIKEMLGVEFSDACELIAARLGSDYVANAASDTKAARKAAELREARQMIMALRQPERGTALSEDDVAWAISRLIRACDDMYLRSASLALREVALLLGIDIMHGHPLPAHLENKIGNAVRALLHVQSARVMAVTN